jgi:hypothetical protein
MQGMKGSGNRPPDDLVSAAGCLMFAIVLAVCLAFTVGYVVGSSNKRLNHVEIDYNKTDAQLGLVVCGIRRGQVHKHYKGGYYSIVAVSIKEDTLEPMVTYHSNAKDCDWTRTLQNFTEMVELPNGEKVKRFTRVEQ